MSHDNDGLLGGTEPGAPADDGSRDLLAALVRSAVDAVVVEALDGNVLYWNPAAERLFGFTADEVVGRPLTRLVPPYCRANAEAQRDRARRGEQVSPVDTVRWAKDGQRIDVSLTISPVWNDAGEVAATSSIIRALTIGQPARQALASREAALYAAFDNAPISMMMTTCDGRPMRVNREMCDMLGYSAAELLALEPSVYTNAEDSEPLRAHMARALAGECGAFEADVRYHHRDGGIVWGKVFTSLARNTAGAPDYFLFQIKDITQARETERELAQVTEELRVSEAKYRTLLEQMPGVVYLLAADENQTPLYFSPNLEELTGETPEEARTNHNWLELVHPDDRERVAAADEQHGESTELFRVEYRHLRKDGSYVWIRDECVPVYDSTGRVVAWQGVMLDISDLMQATQAQAQVAALVESAKDAIISGTVEGIITSWNPGAERLYGYRANEMIGQSFRRLLPENLVDPAYERLLRDVSEGRATEPFETIRRRKDGSTFAVSVAISPVRDHNGAVSGISSITRDITEQKQAEAALQQALVAAEAANQAKSHFLAMMSHELRTPLQAVLGYAELLLANPDLHVTAEQREDIGYIQQGGLRMLTLVNQLLDLSRIEAGRLMLVTREVDLAEILEQVRQDVAPLASQKGLDLTIDASSSLPLVHGDPERLRQILLNLASNAVKFTEQGSVRITSRMTADEVTISVSDTGIGIAPQDIPHIFEAFRQVDNRLSRRHGGAGLGVAIAHKLAELMNGSISVASEVGVGSTFTLTLPITRDAPASIEAPHPAFSESPRANVTPA